MLRSHLRLALVVLARRKVFTAISLFGIALTLMVLTVAVAFLDHVFAPHPPEVRQDRTLVTFLVEMSGPDMTSRGPAGFKLFDGYTRDIPGVERMSIVSMPRGARTYLGGRATEVHLRRSDADYWRILGFRFLEGAPFGDDDVAQARRVAVINARTRERFFGGGPALGRILEADGERWTVVGVVPDVPLLRLVSYSEVWVPLTTLPGDAWRTDLDGSFMGVYLLAPGADPDAVRSEYLARMARVDLSGTPFDKVTAVPDTMFGNTARELFGQRGSAESRRERLYGVLALGALLFALLPTVNLVNLSVSRIMERAGEIGVRKAFGAPTRSLVLQFVLENVVLTAVGGLLALALSAIALRALNASGLIPYADLGLNARIFAAGLLLTLAFGVLSGAWPAWRMARLHPVEALKGGPR